MESWLWCFSLFLCLFLSFSLCKNAIFITSNSVKQNLKAIIPDVQMQIVLNQNSFFQSITNKFWNAQ